jgi:hypothetical protein
VCPWVCHILEFMILTPEERNAANLAAGTTHPSARELRSDLAKYDELQRIEQTVGLNVVNRYEEARIALKIERATRDILESIRVDSDVHALSHATKASDADRARAVREIREHEEASPSRDIQDYLNRISYAYKVANTKEGLADATDFTRPFEFPSVWDRRAFHHG